MAEQTTRPQWIQRRSGSGLVFCATRVGDVRVEVSPQLFGGEYTATVIVGRQRWRTDCENERRARAVGLQLARRIAQ